jgi:hypothetical protein
MANWKYLEAELQHWRAAGEKATLFWRDDDACRRTPQLIQLVETADRAGVPVHLAVIPAKLEKDAITLINASPNTRTLQHGFAHIDHAPKGEGSWELGLHRPLETVLGQLLQGKAILHDAFAKKFLPIIVPPWNRLDEQLIPHLIKNGFVGLSREGDRSGGRENGLNVFNTHCDPIKWKDNARFKGVERVLEDLVGHLRRRRLGKCDRNEPTGLCTHHMDHSEDLWGFLQDYTRLTAEHPATRWASLDWELN